MEATLEKGSVRMALKSTPLYKGNRKDPHFKLESKEVNGGVIYLYEKDYVRHVYFWYRSDPDNVYLHKKIYLGGRLKIIEHLFQTE